VIIVNRLSGQELAVNPDLLGRMESTPDTILVLLDGTRYIVRQSMPEIIDLICDYRACVIARALADTTEDGPHLHAVTTTPTLMPVPRAPDDGDEVN
jgi:Uncharacterized protein, possibly involved in motility